MAHLSILWMNKKAFKVTVVHYFENIGLEGKRNMGKGPKNIHVREGGGGTLRALFQNCAYLPTFHTLNHLKQ